LTLGRDALDLFHARVTTQSDSHDIELWSATFSGRIALPGAAYLLVDADGPAATVVAGPQPDRRADMQTAVYVHRPERALGGMMFAVGPVSSERDALARARVRTELPELESVDALTPGIRGRLVLAVDLDADDTPELELRVHGAADLDPRFQRPLKHYEVWIREGTRRRLRETALQWWPPSGRGMMQRSCGLLPAG
jgi:hypothetical protein